MPTTGGFACAPRLQQHSISTFFLGHPVALVDWKMGYWAGVPGGPYDLSGPGDGLDGSVVTVVRVVQVVTVRMISL